jgi:hypothetical protein
MTDGIPGNDDDRWVYTENNPNREMSTATNLAATARALRGFNDTLATHCVNIAKEIFANAAEPTADPRFGRFRRNGKIQIAAELYQTTGEKQYFDYIIANWETCVQTAGSCAW